MSTRPLAPPVERGRNVRTFRTAGTVAPTATDTLLSLTQWFGNAAVAATTTPAVVTAGKSLRIYQVSVGLIWTAATTLGYAELNLRVNTGGTVAIGSPIARVFRVATPGTPATGVANWTSFPIPEGALEFPAGAGLGVSAVGRNSSDAATAITARCAVEIDAFEFGQTVLTLLFNQATGTQSAELTGASTSGGTFQVQVSTTAVLSGASTSGGTLNATQILVASLAGASTSSGSLTAALRLPITLSGASTSGGAFQAALRVPVALSGASTSGGTFQVALSIPALLAGASTSTGTFAAAISSGPQSYAAQLSGASTSGGTFVAALRVPVVLSGASTSGGTFAVRITSPVTFAGVSTSAGTFAVRLLTAVVLAGSSTSSGSLLAALGVRVELVGQSTSGGILTATGGADIPTLDIGVGIPEGWAIGTAQGWEAGHANGAPTSGRGGGWYVGAAQSGWS